MEHPSFDVASCEAARRKGAIDDWVDRYLAAGPWANDGLRTGLRLAPRLWIGPLGLPLANLERCCGPEPTMKYREPEDIWQRRTIGMASGLTTPEALPPLLVEWRAGTLSIRDGNHRHAAMTLRRWPECWCLVWCNDRQAYDAATAVLCRRV